MPMQTLGSSTFNTKCVRISTRMMQLLAIFKFLSRIYRTSRPLAQPPRSPVQSGQRAKARCLKRDKICCSANAVERPALSTAYDYSQLHRHKSLGDSAADVQRMP